MTGPAVQAIRAWIRLRDRHLPWQPDAVSIVRDDQDQIELQRFHAINFDAILSRVEKRGGPRLSWEVDWDKGEATLGPAEVGFYKLLNGGFSLSTYHRSDGFPDVDRDAELIEDAVYCIAQTLKKRDPQFGPVALIAHDGPSKGRIASQRLENFATLKEAIRRACQKLGTHGFHEPFITTQAPVELLYDHHELRRICERRAAVPPALEAVAAHTKKHAHLFVRSGPKLLGPDQTRQRQRYIEGLADKIRSLANDARDGLVSYQEFDTLLGALHEAGFYPEGELVSAVTRALVS